MSYFEDDDIWWETLKLRLECGIPPCSIAGTYDAPQYGESKRSRLRRIRLRFCDFADFDHIKESLRRRILLRRYELDEEASPDFLICGGLGFNHLKYDCVKIAFLSENISSPDAFSPITKV